MERAGRAFGDIVIDDTEQTAARRREEKEARLAKQAFKPQTHIIEIVGHTSDEDEDDAVWRSELLTRKTSKEIANEVEISHE